MMILGMGLSGLKGGGHLDWKFINLSLIFKFILWPLLMFGLIIGSLYPSLSKSRVLYSSDHICISANGREYGDSRGFAQDETGKSFHRRLY
ncbi:hypothetical protein EHQ30_01390 [Leptospira brenneri]|uniref:Uncharacterized protein n=1 Tax=Leptospira brenneri TaxID=2023182 RepID=A0A5F1Z7E8_9LEPT|nr:hypothetical protein [Leptospira brenneri]TGK95321.1 hypothetical protein EHQ30_01390 [Leptospira brenneri]